MGPFTIPGAMLNPFLKHFLTFWFSPKYSYEFFWKPASAWLISTSLKSPIIFLPFLLQSFPKSSDRDPCPEIIMFASLIHLNPISVKATNIFAT
jgi:hypothetical protein